MSELKAKICHYTDVLAEEMGDEAPGVTMRWIIDEENDNAPNFALRVVEVAPAGHTPNHNHPYEHENFIIEGKGQVLIDDEWHDIVPGDVVLVPPGVQHSYANTGQSMLRFLCGIPVSRLRPA